MKLLCLITFELGCKNFNNGSVISHVVSNWLGKLVPTGGDRGITKFTNCGPKMAVFSLKTFRLFISIDLFELEASR